MNKVNNLPIQSEYTIACFFLALLVAMVSTGRTGAGFMSLMIMATALIPLVPLALLLFTPLNNYIIEYKYEGFVRPAWGPGTAPLTLAILYFIAVFLVSASNRIINDEMVQDVFVVTETKVNVPRNFRRISPSTKKLTNCLRLEADKEYIFCYPPHHVEDVQVGDSIKVSHTPGYFGMSYRSRGRPEVVSTGAGSLVGCAGKRINATTVAMQS